MSADSHTNLSIKEKENAWLVSPLIDLLFVAGGAVWILFSLHSLLFKGTLTGGVAELFLTISATGAIIFAETHTIATMLTLYGNKATREKHSFHGIWLAAICLGLILLGLIEKDLAPIYLKLYLLFIPHHFMNQCYGVALLYCFKRGYKIAGSEKLALRFFTESVAWYAVLKQLTYPSWSGMSLLNTKIPFWGPLPEHLCLLSGNIMNLAAAILVSIIVWKSFRGKDFLPLPSQLTILTGTLAFTLGPSLIGIYWLYVSAFFHGTQYLIIATARHYNAVNADKKAMGAYPLTFKNPAIKFLALSQLISICVYLVIPNIALLAGLEELKLGVILFALVNLFHILTDSAIWKLRDPLVRSHLTPSEGARIVARKETTKSRLCTPTNYFYQLSAKPK